MTRTGVSGGRKTAYNLGTSMIVAGFLLAFGSVLPVFSLFGAAGDFVGGAVSGAARGKGPEARVVTGFVEA